MFEILGTRHSFMEVLYNFVFFYPFFMAHFWVVGAMLFFWRRERGRLEVHDMSSAPFVSVLVPCHNEALVIESTIRQLCRSRYPSFEIIVIDDASRDGTRAILERLIHEIPKVRLIGLSRNLGKAKALSVGAVASDAEYLMCIDADALLDEDAMGWLVHDLERSPRAGAVTGNPRVLNRGSLLSQIQVGEYSAIVGMIKRTQRLIGRVYTVSGVCACFRKRAVHEVGYWSSDTVTDDVDISWKLQLAFWGIQYEPRALCWFLVPDTFRDLWRQRLRWARGGIEAGLKHLRAVASWKRRRMWPVFVELVVSTIWCYAMFLTVLFFLLTWALRDAWPQSLRIWNLLPGWTGSLLAITCLVQFAAGLILDSHYEGRRLVGVLFWAIWYPAAYWLITAIASVVAVPMAVRSYGKYRYATWKSPDR